MSHSRFLLKSRSSNETYNIIERLDHGAFSVVWLADQKEEDRKVAIKIQDTDCFGTPTYTELPLRARRELHILETIRHPNIIRLHEHFIHQESFVQIFDFFPMNLNTFITKRRSKLTLMRIRHILFQILSGFCALHAKEIAHRDMKPHNVVINPDDNDHVCLIDFGCARLLPSTLSAASSRSSSASSSASSLMDLANLQIRGGRDRMFAFPIDGVGEEESEREKSLTPQVVNRPYRSPELLLGEKQYTCAIDVWAVGCTMYELLMGKIFVCENADWKQLVALFEKLGGPFDLDGIGHANFFQYEGQDGLSKDELFEGMTVRGSEVEWRDLMVLWDGLMTQNYFRRMTADYALRLDVFIDFA